LPCLPWRSPSPHARRRATTPPPPTPADPIQAACNQLVALDAQIARWAPVAAIWGYDLDALIAEREEVQKVLITADVLCVPREA